MTDNIVKFIPKGGEEKEKINQMLISQIEELLTAAKAGDVKDIVVIQSRWSDDEAEIILVPPQDFAHINLMIDITKQTLLDMAMGGEGLDYDE